MPNLIESIDTINSNLSVESLRVLSEICSIFLHKKESILNEDLKKQLKKHIEINFIEV